MSNTLWQFPNPKTVVPGERAVQRVLECIPGTLSWGALLAMVLVSIYQPFWGAVFILIFDIYWIYRAVYISIFTLIAKYQVRVGEQIPWQERLSYLKREDEYLKVLSGRLQILKAERSKLHWWSDWKQTRAISRSLQVTRLIYEETTELSKHAGDIVDPSTVWHVVMLPTAGEPAEIVADSLEALTRVSYSKDRIIVLLATEEREPEETRLPKVNFLREKYAKLFADFIVTTHVVEAGELKCKASNAGYAARHLMKYLDEKSIRYEDVLFSNFDCDSVVHPEYFGALTYAFAVNPDRLLRAYQPLPVYNNNLWDTNAFVRLVVTGSSFWHLFQSTRRGEMVTFSSHTEPFATLVRVGFWPVNMISEDSVIYWKCMSYYHGRYKVEPIHLPISLDAVLAPTYWQTVMNQYKQKRRWAYGIENFPVTMRAIWPDRQFPFWRKMRITFEMLEGHFSWATTAWIISILGWLPLVLGGQVFQETVLAHNLPLFTRVLMTVGMVGLVVTIPLSFFSLPAKPARYSRWKYAPMLLQWILSPLVYLLSAIPALDSQTRLLLGKYFGEFWVTEKMRK